MAMPGIFHGTGIFLAIAAGLFLINFGLAGSLICVICILLFFAGAFIVLLLNGWERAGELSKEFDALDTRCSSGIPQFLKRSVVDRRARRVHSERLTGSHQLDPIIEEILSFALRDFVESWYASITNDELLLEALKSSAFRTVSVLNSSLRKVDWVPLVTQHIVDDFASHIRLYRKARERVSPDARKESADGGEGELEALFFDMELEMEKSYCRDLVSTSPHYENAYLHDLADLFLYLVLPPEDFRSRPFRFLLREILVGKILHPLIDQLSDPDYVNNTIVWLLNEVPISPDDFLSIVEASDNAEELAAVREAVDEEIAVQRSKDTGGEQDSFIKQQLSSLFYVRRLVDSRMRRLRSGADDEPGSDEMSENSESSKLCELPLSFVLANNISISYFIDYLAQVGGQAYIDLFLAIEGFKVSVEHQLSTAHLNKVTRGEAMDPEILETIREAAWCLYEQYLSDKAKDRVELDGSMLKQLASTIKHGEPSENWFQEVQSRIYEVLSGDVRYYPAFRRNPLYFRMLADLALVTSDGSQVVDLDVSQCEEAYDGMSVKSTESGGSGETTGLPFLRETLDKGLSFLREALDKYLSFLHEVLDRPPILARNARQIPSYCAIFDYIL